MLNQDLILKIDYFGMEDMEPQIIPIKLLCLLGQENLQTYAKGLGCVHGIHRFHLL